MIHIYICYTYIHDFILVLFGIINILFLSEFFFDFYNNCGLGSNGTGKWYTLQNMC